MVYDDSQFVQIPGLELAISSQQKRNIRQPLKIPAPSPEVHP